MQLETENLSCETEIVEALLNCDSISDVTDVVELSDVRQLASANLLLKGKGSFIICELKRPWQLFQTHEDITQRNKWLTTEPNIYN